MKEPVFESEPAPSASGDHSMGRHEGGATSSITTLHTRTQLTIAFALVVVIPGLVLGYQVTLEEVFKREGYFSFLWIAIFALFCVCLGFYIVARQAVNVTHLRIALEQLLEGETPTGQAELAPVSSDVPAIELTLQTLQQRVAERHEREKVEMSMREAQEHLEGELREHSQQLEDANTKLQEQVEERQRAESLKDEFVSTVSHELRTPLAITKEGVNLLLDEIPGELNDKQKKLLGTISDNMSRLTRIINDLLDISKIEAGKMEMDKARVDVKTFVDDVVAPMVTVAEKKGITITTEFADDLPEVYADKDRMVQVLTNLAGNALKFTDEGGVTVRAYREDDFVICRVEDTGVGLSEEEARAVFDKFVQVGRTHGAGIKGTGLGLAISRQIVGLHGGRIWVESEKGTGSAFLFSLPVFAEAQIVHDKVEQVIEEARDAQEGFVFLLFETERGDCSEESFADGFQRLIDTQTHVRSSDLAIPRGDNQIILLANVQLDKIGILYRRWESQVMASYMDAGALDVRLRCGYAQYPEDGSVPEDLLAHAMNTLSDMGNVSLESSEQGGESQV